MRRTISRWLVPLCIGSILVWSSAGSAGDSPDTDVRVRGQANAPLTLIEYSDFTCGYCLKFFKDTWPRIQARYVDTGKVRFIYRDYPRADQVLASMRRRQRAVLERRASIGRCMIACLPKGADLTSRCTFAIHRQSVLISPHLNAVSRMDDTPPQFSKIARKPTGGGFMELLGSFL
ncbi:MAG: thioredoxin domain-containing protein [Nitrospira sp.]|nr:thioredoxin domain-containing protein [Nitrospira sp.]